MAVIAMNDRSRPSLCHMGRSSTISHNSELVEPQSAAFISGESTIRSGGVHLLQLCAIQ